MAVVRAKDALAAEALFQGTEKETGRGEIMMPGSHRQQAVKRRLGFQKVPRLGRIASYLKRVLGAEVLEVRQRRHALVVADLQTHKRKGRPCYWETQRISMPFMVEIHRPCYPTQAHL